MYCHTLYNSTGVVVFFSFYFVFKFNAKEALANLDRKAVKKFDHSGVVVAPGIDDDRWLLSRSLRTALLQETRENWVYTKCYTERQASVTTRLLDSMAFLERRARTASTYNPFEEHLQCVRCTLQVLLSDKLRRGKRLRERSSRER
jgi:hypothetical protein